MNTHVTPTPALPGAAGHLGRNVLLAVLGGAAILAVVLALVILSRGASDEAPPVSAPVVVAPAAESEGAVLGAVTVAVEPSVRTVYIVGSDAQAEFVAANVADGNAILGALGEPLQLASVLVAGTDAEAAAVTALLGEGNLVLRSLGEPEDVVVDLRQ